MHERESKMRRKICALNAAVAALGVFGMAGWAHGQTTVIGTITNGVDIENSGAFQETSAKDFVYSRWL